MWRAVLVLIAACDSTTVHHIGAFMTGQDQAFAIAVDDENVYWTTEPTNGTGGVFSAAKTGGKITTLVSGGGGVALAVDANNIYWIGREQSTPFVLQMSKSGGTPIQLATSPDPIDLAIDAQYVYWTDSTMTMGTVSRVPIGGGTVTQIATAQSQPTGIAVDANAVYWIDQFTGAVLVVPFAQIGSPPMMLATSGGNLPISIAVDSTNVYWTTEGANPQIGGGVFSVPKTGGATTTLDSGLLDPFSIASDDTSIYWLDDILHSKVRKLPIGASTPTTLYSQTGLARNLALDATTLYWTSPDNGTISSIAK